MPNPSQVEGDHVRFTPDQFNADRMMSIVRHMKEIPELPSEKPKDTSTLLEVRFPEEGGVLTHMSGQAEAYKGFPFYEMVDKIDLMKKVIRSTLSSFFHSIKRRNKLQLATIVLVPWFLNDFARAGIYTFFRTVERFKVKPIMYSTSMRELYRAFSIERDGETLQEKELREQARLLICMTLEFDNAYRFRFQDIVNELDKVALHKNPAKELVRLLSLMQTREKGQDVADTWTLFKTFLPVVLWLHPKTKKTIKTILGNIDLDKIRLSREDKNFCIPRSDYTFGFMVNPNEEDKKQIELVMHSRQLEDERIKVRDESTKAHEALFAQQKEEMTVSQELEKQIVDETNTYLLECNKEGQEKFEIGRKAILNKYLTPELLQTVDRHQQEREKMDKEFTEKLTAVDSL